MQHRWTIIITSIIIIITLIIIIINIIWRTLPEKCSFIKIIWRKPLKLLQWFLLNMINLGQSKN